MPIDFVAITSGISTINNVVITLKKYVSYIKEKNKDVEVFKDLESEIQNLDSKLVTISAGAESINAYFELNGYALELYTTADDFIKNIIKAPDETRDLLAEISFSNLSSKFNRIEHFLETYSGYVAQEDEGKIEVNIKYLNKNLIEGHGHLNEKKYNDCEKKIMEIISLSNDLRELSRAKLLRLVIELKKVGK